MKNPNLFIVGAPRCGTTAIYSYLRSHPDIYMSQKKEIGYFGSDVYNNKMSKEQYLNFFTEGKDIQGEASTWYLYSKKAAKDIHDFNPNAKIIICLRNQIQAAYSLYYLNKQRGREKYSFDRAIDMVPERRKGKFISSDSRPDVYFYTEVYKYYEQVKRYMDLFSNVKIINYDTFFSSPKREYESLLKFLNLRNHKIDFRKINANKTVRWELLKRIHHSNIMARMGSIIPKKFRKKMSKFIERHNLVEKDRPPMSEKARKKLISAYQQDNDKLKELIGYNFELE